MKRKFTFFGICVLLCTLMISLGSCQKDYSDDIDDLQNQINANKTAIEALNSAIASGKLIKSVAPNATGYVITFSDNSTITINHGQTGPQGPAGTPGQNGQDGFTPIVGVDADGFWTVVASQGAAPVRIKDANNNDIRAKFSDELAVNADGMLTVGGVATTVFIPTIAYIEATQTLLITVKKADGTLASYNVPVADNVFSKTEIVSLISPIGETKVHVGYGKVPATNAAVHATLGAEGLAWAGVTLNQQLRSGGVLPIVLNPADVVVDGYEFEIIKANGSTFGIQPESVTKGYDGAFAQFAAGTSNGLYTLNLNPTLAQISPLDGTTTTELAVRATKNGREIVSGYQYTIRVAADAETMYAPKATETILAGIHTIYVPIGTMVDVLPKYDRTDVAPNRTLVSTDFFKSGLIINPATINFDVQDYAIVDGTKVGTGNPSLITVSNLNDKKLSYFFRTFDWTGKYKKNNLDVIFYAPLNTPMADITVPTHVLDATNQTKGVMLTPMFAALQEEGKTELWRSTATNVKVVWKNAAGVVVGVPQGLEYEFRDATDAPVNVPNAVLTNQAQIQSIRKVVLGFDETVALPGTYTATLVFDDPRPYAAGVEFELKMNVTVVNPDMSAVLTAMAEHKSNMFNGNILTVYGKDMNGSGLTQDQINTYYPIMDAYVNLSLAGAPVAPKVGINNWAFVKNGTTPAGAPLSTTAYGNGGTFNVLTGMYTNYNVDLLYYYFGNPANKAVVETIVVTAKSEVKEGNMVALTPAAPAPATLQVINGDLVTVRNLSTYYRVNDYLGNNLNVFSASRNVRANVVTVTPDASLAHLVNITSSGNDWTVKATNAVAELPTPFVDVPLTLEITDLYNVKTTYTLNVRVVKP